ncbi:PhzF family phenazine biosynthesis protein [Actinomycetospora flava]|uniref:PhzF family phenazine biosynthesis protein n=1 Tax=Actinomycetospora flava TaxID=3129232 RepID=A0ABU8MBV1_9PSEU
MLFHQVDVFADELTRGNAVAVVHDADGLSEETMAGFARWTNLAETTFLLAPTTPAADYRVRIFTPVRELPFAGHPTLGSARAWLEAGGQPARDRVVQECGVGLVEVRREGARLAFAAPPLVRGGPVDGADVAHLARALGVGLEAVVDAQWVDNGPGWVALLLRDAAAVLALEPDRTAFAPFGSIGVAGPYEPGAPVALEVRAFVPQNGLGEDPVTGSLNASLAQWLIGAGRLPRRYVAAQGTRLHRRGRIHVAEVDGEVWVGGDTVVGIAGTADLRPSAG